MKKITPKRYENKVDSAPMVQETYPTFYISTEYLPEAKKWEIGKTYKLTVLLRQTGISQRKGSDGKEHGSADFDIVGIESHGEASKATKPPKRYG